MNSGGKHGGVFFDHGQGNLRLGSDVICGCALIYIVCEL